MPESCVRCSQAGEAPPAHRVPFPPEVKEKVLSSVCAACWKEWEGMEIKVINKGGNSCDVFPQTGSQIDANGVSTADAVADGVQIIYTALSTTLWDSHIGA